MAKSSLKISSTMSVKGKSTGAPACPVDFVPARNQKQLNNAASEFTNMPDWDEDATVRGANRVNAELHRLESEFSIFKERKLTSVREVSADLRARGADGLLTGNRMLINTHMDEAAVAAKKATFESAHGYAWEVGSGSLEDVVRHESGHFIVDRHLDEFAQERIFKQVGTDTIRAELGEWAAAKGPSEMFAEAFSAYTMPGYKVGTLPSALEMAVENAIRAAGGKTL